ncbi:MAG: cytochrome ubiquinol oxidase subunit I [Planctomycetota bacterium]
MTYYPINDFGPAMKGMVIGGLGIFHVYLAQFAIGGGMLMTYFQWLGMQRDGPGAKAARGFVDGMFRVLVLISFITGALTGVAMWLTTIQVSPRTIGVMVDEFHWVWAIEWTFFCLEVAAGYAFYRWGPRLSDGARLTLLAAYSLAAWMSLFWINGILSWQLTPGGFLPGDAASGGSVWAGFFNPTFWPSLLFRTVSSMATAALVAALVVNLAPGWSRSRRREVVRHAFHFLTPMVLMPLLGIWFVAAMPADSRGWALGGSIAMTLFFSIGVGASLLIGAYAATIWLNRRLTVNGSTAALLVMLGFAATAGAEFVREGVRKPYTVRGALYSNAIAEGEVAKLREEGCTTQDPYPLRDGIDYANEQLRLGSKVFRVQCSVCHTWDGANGVAHLAETWTVGQLRQNLAQLQRTKPFMPPFAGTAAEAEALVQWIDWRRQGAPQAWPESNNADILRQIQTYLDEAGVESAVAQANRHTGQPDDT